MSAITSPIAGHAGRHPNRTALIFEDTEFCWADLAAVMERIAAALTLKVPPGGGVALHLPNSPALALLFLAAARAGREAQVLDPDWPRETTMAILAELAPTMIITSDHQLNVPGAILLDDPDLCLEDLASRLDAPIGHPLVSQPEDNVPFYVGFTSGSTGKPKGYRRSHRSWVESFRGDAVEFGLDGNDVVLAPGALTHSLFLYAIVHGLYVGATVILCRRFRPVTTLRLLHQANVTVLYAVPTHLRLLLEAAGEDSIAHNLRWILSSGAKWSADEMPRLRRCMTGARFAEFYGASELSFVTVAKDNEQVPDGSVGRAFFGVGLTVRDRRGRRLPPRRTGLVYVDSPLVFSGYAVGGEGDLHRAGDAMSVGDVGFMDENGFLHLVGRANRMIITSGKNLYGGEVERALERHPSIAVAAVFGVADVKRGERLIALISPQPGELPTRAALITHMRTLLPLYKVPRRYGLVLDWPRTRSDKTDFDALRRLCDSGAYEPLT